MKSFTLHYGIILFSLRNVYFSNRGTKKHVLYMIVLLNYEGEFYDFSEFQRIFKVNGTFIEYYRLIAAIPNKWKQEITFFTTKVI